jgi:DNA modification methylase
MGSGTTAIACLNTKRKFIGFEMDDKYYDIATKRVKEWKEIK